MGKIYRRRRFKIYERIGRPVIGFYKDYKRRTRPITPRMGRRRSRYISKVRVHLYPKRIHVGKQFLDATLSYVLSQAPIAKELHIAYAIADALYKNWNLIDELYDIYNEEGLAGATNVVGTNIVHDVLSSVQTDIAWATINPFIPKEYHNMGKQILANIMDQVTSGEIKLVSQFLQSRRSQKLTNCEVGGGNINSIKTTAYRYRKRKRLPKEMRHV